MTPFPHRGRWVGREGQPPRFGDGLNARFLARVQVGELRRSADPEPRWRIELQHAHCCAADRRTPHNLESVPHEVVVPLIASRIEQHSHLAAIGIEPREIAAFVQIALGTGKSEIVQVIRPGVFPRNDMLDLQRDQRRCRLTSLALLAAVACPPPHSRPCCGVHPLRPILAETESCLGLQNGQQIIGLDIALVFFAIRQ